MYQAQHFLVKRIIRLLLHAGPEIAVASTKAYVAQVAVLAITAYVSSTSTRQRLRL